MIIRTLLLSLSVVLLTACAPSEPTSRSQLDRAVLPAKLYKNIAELGGAKFTDIGDVTGSSCQISTQDTPPNITEARQDMLQRAGRMNANAVLLEQCEMVGNTPGCYRSAVCSGAAISIPSL